MTAYPTDEHVLRALRAPAPCDACEHARRCAARELACSAFSTYVHGQRWRDATREPTRRRYTRMFVTEKPLRCRPRGLQPATLAKYAALRALRDTFPTVRAVLAAVGLTDWSRISKREPELAAHVLSLVVCADKKSAATPSS